MEADSKLELVSPTGQPGSFGLPAPGRLTRSAKKESTSRLRLPSRRVFHARGARVQSNGEQIASPWPKTCDLLRKRRRCVPLVPNSTIPFPLPMAKENGGTFAPIVFRHTNKC